MRRGRCWHRRFVSLLPPWRCSHSWAVPPPAWRNRPDYWPLRSQRLATKPHETLKSLGVPVVWRREAGTERLADSS